MAVLFIILSLISQLVSSETNTDTEILNKWTKTNEAKLIQKYQIIESQWFEKECLHLAQSLNFEQLVQCQVFESDIINAYVFNNGHVYFSLGIMQLIKNKQQWAAILAHENAHIVLHHYLNTLKYLKKPAVFFPKSKLKKLLKHNEKAADDWSQQILKKHNIDYSQINYFLGRIISLKGKTKNTHLKLSKRIRKTKGIENIDQKLILNISQLSN